jgi:hypothetical protein
MAIAAALTVSNDHPAHGETITFTYAVTGNTGTPAILPAADSVTGIAHVGAQDLAVSTTVMIPGSPAVPPLPETYTTPAGPPLVITATADPHVFTAVVP